MILLMFFNIGVLSLLIILLMSLTLCIFTVSNDLDLRLLQWCCLCCVMLCQWSICYYNCIENDIFIQLIYKKCLWRIQICFSPVSNVENVKYMKCPGCCLVRFGNVYNLISFHMCSMMQMSGAGVYMCERGESQRS